MLMEMSRCGYPNATTALSKGSLGCILAGEHHITASFAGFESSRSWQSLHQADPCSLWILMYSMYIMKTYCCCCLIAQLLAYLMRNLSGKLLLILLSLMLAALLILNVVLFQRLSEAKRDIECLHVLWIWSLPNSWFTARHLHSFSSWFLFLRRRC